MNILDKRPLSTVLIVMLSGLVFYSRVDNSFLKAAVAVIAGVALLFLCVVTLLIKKRLILPKICVIMFLLACLFSFLYFDIWAKPADRATGEARIEGVVTEIDDSLYYFSATLKADKINGKPCSYKIRFTADSKHKTKITEGAVISFTANLANVNDFGDSSYYKSEGIHALAEVKSDFEVTDYVNTLEKKLSDYRTEIYKHATLLSDADTGALITALLVGEREFLGGQVTLDFQRCGISHMLALSGMHLAILTFALEAVLSFFRVNKRARKIISIIFVTIYMLLTGMPLSVVRAGLMLIIANLLFLLVGCRDTLTNLIISVFIICFASPYSVYSLSLWLSVFSTLGIIIFIEAAEKKRKSKNILLSFLRWCLCSFLSTVFAVGATFVIIVLYFDGISLSMIFTNLILAFLLEIYIYFGIFVIILGGIIPLGRLASVFTRFIFSITSFFSNIKFSYASLEFISVRVLMWLFAILFFAFVLFKIRHKKLFIAILVFVFSSVLITAGMLTYRVADENTVTYFSDKNGDKVLCTSASEIMIIDSSGHSESSASSTYNIVSDSRITYIDKYIITHYSRGIDEMLMHLCSRVMVEEIYLPTPKNADEASITKTVISATENYRCKISYYGIDSKIENGESQYIKTYGTEYNKEDIKLAYKIKLKEKQITYLSSGMMDALTKEIATQELENTSSLILGCYGKRYKGKYLFTNKEQRLENIILSSENLYFSRDALIYYENNNTSIYHKPSRIELYVE